MTQNDVNFKFQPFHRELTTAENTDQTACAHWKKKGCKNQESIQLSTIPYPGYQWGSDKLTIRRHKREPSGQPFPSRWPQSTYKQTRTMTKANTRQNKNTKDPQKKYRLGTVSNIFYWSALTGLTAPTSPLIQMWIKTHTYLVCMKDP